MNTSIIQKLLRLRDPKTIVIFVVLVALVLWIDKGKEEQGGSDPQVSRGVTEGVCVNVIDGDTIDVRTESGEEIRIRLLGIDCMETHNEEKMAEQAERHERSIEEIRRIGLRAKSEVRDFALNLPVSWDVPKETPIRDPYDRVLAYVSVDGVDLGEYLLTRGLAEVRRDQHPRLQRYRSVVKPLMR